MCVLCVLEWILFSGKEGQKHFSLALNNNKFLYENKFKAFNIIIENRETEIRSRVLMKCSIKEGLFKEFFFFVFVFKFIVPVLTTSCHPLSSPP